MLEYLVRLRGGKEAAADLDAVGAAGERVHESFKGIAGMALGGLAIFSGFEGLKSAVENTQKLAVGAASLAKVTGMNVNQSAQWLAVTQAFGVNTRTMTMSLKALSTQTENALGGTKKSQGYFHALGITMDDLKKHSGNLNDLMGFVADKFNAMPGGVAKTAVATALFGRGWQQLIPLLSQGSKGMDDLRKTAAEYGVTLGKDPLKNAAALHEAEVKLKLAQTGLEVQLSEKLAPAFIAIFNKALALYRVIDKSLNPAWKWLTNAIKDASKWLGKHKDEANALKVALMVLVGALVAVRVATILANLALLDSPIGWIILGIAALAAGFDLLWHKSTNFRTNLTNVFNWMKGAAADVAKAFGNMATWVGNAFNNVVAAVKSALVWLVGAVKSVADAVNSVTSSIPGFGGNVIDTSGLAAIQNSLLGRSTPAGPAATKIKPGQKVTSPAGTDQAPTRRGITPTGANMAPITPHGADMAPHIHLVIDGREWAHVTRRQVLKAMAANA